MTELFQFEFFRNALIGGILLSILASVMGCYIIVNRIVYISGGIAHAIFGGVGLGYYFGFDPMLGALGVGGLSSVLLGIFKKKVGGN